MVSSDSCEDPRESNTAPLADNCCCTVDYEVSEYFYNYEMDVIRGNCDDIRYYKNVFNYDSCDDEDLDDLDNYDDENGIQR